mgnify:CR=1 FL=1
MQVFFAAKALVNLVNAAEIRPRFMENRLAQAVLMKLATHTEPRMWLRAAKIIRVLAMDTATVTELLKWGDVCASLYALDESSRFVREALEAIQSAS